MTQTMKIGSLVILSCVIIYFVFIPMFIVEPSSAHGALSARLIPRVITIGMAAVSLAMIVSDVTTKYVVKATPRTAPGIRVVNLPRVGLVFAIMVVYYFLITWIGYLLATFAILALLQVTYGTRKPITIAAVSILFPVILYFLFGRLMEVPLPQGLIFR